MPGIAVGSSGAEAGRTVRPCWSWQDYLGARAVGEGAAEDNSSDKVGGHGEREQWGRTGHRGRMTI